MRPHQPVQNAPHPGDTAPAAELWTALPASARNVRSARHMLCEWLETLHWPDEQRNDIVLAVNEALSNVVDHAYPPGATGQAELYAWEALDPQEQLRRIIAVVTDHGRWKPAAVRPSYRSRGLPMMDACMASVQIEPSPGGTSVIMTSAASQAAADLAQAAGA